MIKYKRKFLVPGNSIPSCSDYQKRCDKKYGWSESRKPCAIKNTSSGHRYYYTKNETLCPYPINTPRKYIVAETVDGEWQCSCPVWKFRREECHHIRKAQADPEKYEISPDFTGKTVETMDKLLGR